MALALEDRAMKDDIMLGDTPKALNRRRKMKNVEARGRLWKHSTLSDIDGIVLPHHVERMFTFTLVRNPWDRMVSYYTLLQSQSFDHPAVKLAKAQDFSGFINDPHTQISVQRAPYASYVTPDAHFFRLEHLEEDLTPLWKHLGFQLGIPMINQSARPRDWRPFYSSVDAELIAKICAQDISRSGYQFDPS